MSFKLPPWHLGWQHCTYWIQLSCKLNWFPFIIRASSTSLNSIEEFLTLSLIKRLLFNFMYYFLCGCSLFQVWYNLCYKTYKKHCSHVNSSPLFLLSLQVSTVPQERRTLKSTVPEGAELQVECLLVRQVRCTLCACVCVSMCMRLCIGLEPLRFGERQISVGVGWWWGFSV